MDLHLFGLLFHMQLWHCLEKYILNYLFCKLSGNKENDDNCRLQIRLAHNRELFRVFLSLFCSFSVLALAGT